MAKREEREPYRRRHALCTAQPLLRWRAVVALVHRRRHERSNSGTPQPKVLQSSVFAEMLKVSCQMLVSCQMPVSCKVSRVSLPRFPFGGRCTIRKARREPVQTMELRRENASRSLQ